MLYNTHKLHREQIYIFYFFSDREKKLPWLLNEETASKINLHFISIMYCLILFSWGYIPGSTVKLMNHIHESARMPIRSKQLELHWLLIHFGMNLKFWLPPLSIESFKHTTEIHQIICKILNANSKTLCHSRSYSYIMFRHKYSFLKPSPIMASYHKKEKWKQ